MSSQTPSRPATLGSAAPRTTWYLPFLILISGLGGLLAGVDFGIIAGALLYVDKTIPMTEVQQGLMVSIYFIGGLIAALFAGAMADWVGRKKTMIAAGLIFITSILLIYTSSGFASLLVGRTLMGLSGGLICVVVPLFMAECLPSEIRGRGTSAFQFMLVVGLPIATLVAKYFTRVHDAVVAAAAGNPDLIFAADDKAWRYMFLVAAVPGVLFTFGALFLKESPRWLFRRKREDQALAVLRLSRTEEQAALELREMEEHGDKNEGSSRAPDSTRPRPPTSSSSSRPSTSSSPSSAPCSWTNSAAKSFSPSAPQASSSHSSRPACSTGNSSRNASMPPKSSKPALHRTGAA